MHSNRKSTIALIIDHCISNVTAVVPQILRIKHIQDTALYLYFCKIQ